MSTFYKPFTINIKKVPVILYPMIGLESVLERKEGIIENHLNTLYERHDLGRGEYHITIIWTDAGAVMTDVWIFQEIESEETGFVVDCKTFKGIGMTIGEGITASDGLIVLGREAELEEEMRKAGQSIKAYLTGDRPEIPHNLVSDESFGGN